MVLEETGSLLNYSYTSSGLANDPLQELHYRFLGLLFQFTMISLLLYASVIALSFISVTVIQIRPRPYNMVHLLIVRCPIWSSMDGSILWFVLNANQDSFLQMVLFCAYLYDYFILITLFFVCFLLNFDNRKVNGRDWTVIAFLDGYSTMNK